MERAATGEADEIDEVAGASRPSDDIREAPMYQLAMLASLSDRKGQAAFNSQFGVSLGEWRVLANILHLEAASLADLSRAMLLDKGQLSRTVQKLVQRGWVNSDPAPNHRGALLLTVTPLGREQHAALLDFALARNEHSMSALTPEERDCFMICLRKLRDHIARQYWLEVGEQPTHQKKTDGAEGTRALTPQD